MNIKEETKGAFLELSYWWGGRRPGYNGIAIKQDGTIIKYEVVHRFKELVERVGMITPDDLEKLKNYLLYDEKVFETDYNTSVIMDSGVNVTINIDDKTREIKNVAECYYRDNEDKLYDRLLKKVTDLQNSSK